MKDSVKRDGMILVGCLIIPYIIAGIFDIKELDIFFYVMFMIMLSAMMSCMHVVMYKRFSKENDTAYRIVAVMLNFQSINMIFGLLMNMANHRSATIFIQMLFECNLLELLCVPLYIKYAGKKVKQEHIVVCIEVCFFSTILISKIIYHYFGMAIYQCMMIGIAVLLLLTNVIGIYVMRRFKWKLSEKGVKYLNAFWAIRSLYYAAGIYQSLNSKAQSAVHPAWILMYIKFIGVYFLGVSVYYNCLEKSWNQLVEKVKNTKEKIYSNNQDRDTIINLSHELKTPINVIQSATQILRLDDKLDKSAVNELQHIRYECNEAMKLITNMIDINKLRGGHLKTKFEVCNIVEVIENIVEAFALEYKGANLVFNTNEEEAYLKLDTSLLQRAGMYIIGTMLNEGRTDIYVDLEAVTINKAVSVKVYARDICKFIKDHQQDMVKYKTEEIGDLLAIEFIRRILELHQAQVIFEGSGCLQILFKDIISLDEMDELDETTDLEEILYLEDNINELREQIKTSYHIC